MALTCLVCACPAQHEPDRLRVECGESLRSIARRHGVSKDALIRHRNAHLPKALAKAREAREVAHGKDLPSQLRDLQERACRVLDEAANLGDLRTALMAIREARRCMGLIGKATGELVKRHAHLHASAELPPDLAHELNENLRKVSEARERDAPITRERMLRHVLDGKDAVASRGGGGTGGRNCDRSAESGPG